MSDPISLIFYIVCFFASASLFSIGINRCNRLIKLIALTIPTLLIGLRVNVGTDYEAYVSIFHQYSSLSVPNILVKTEDSFIEIGFLGLIKLTSLFTNEAWLMFLLSAIITLGIAYMAIKRLSPKSVPLAFLLYLLIIAPFVMNGVRQGIAVSIVFYAYSYIVTGKPVRYLATILTASLFHASAIAILPLYLLRFIAIRKRTDAPFTLLLSIVAAVLFALSIPLAVLAISAIPTLSIYTHYQGWEVGIARFSLVLMTAIAAAVIVSYRRIANSQVTMQLMTILFFFEFASVFLGSISAAFSRMSLYLAIGGIVYMANIPLIFSSNTKRIVQFITIVYALSYFICFYYFFGYSDIIPYKSIWGGF